MHKMATTECQALRKYQYSLCCRWKDICNALGQGCCGVFVLSTRNSHSLHVLQAFPTLTMLQLLACADNGELTL